MFNFDSIITVILHGGWFLLLLNRFRINFAFKNARTLVLVVHVQIVCLFYLLLLLYTIQRNQEIFVRKQLDLNLSWSDATNISLIFFIYFFIKNELKPFLIFKSVAFGSDPSWPDQAKKGSDTNRSGSALVHSDVKKIESEIIGLIVRYSYVCTVLMFYFWQLIGTFWWVTWLQMYYSFIF